jgi:hypothetical protein
MRGFGLDPAEGTWFIVNPAHIAVARSHLMMNDLRRLALSDAHSRALFATAKPFFDELGYTLLYAGADTWCMRADGWAGMDTATPDCAAGMNLTEWLPLGEHAIAYRKLQNEVQMLWHNHPANVERESRQLATVNSFWLWGGATAADTVTAAPALVCLDAPAWLSALAGRGAPSVTELLAFVAGTPAPQARQDTLLYCGSVAEAALAADWGLWLQQMERLDCDLFAPLHAALLAGRVKQLRLVLGRRDALAELTTTQMAQRKFWRRPTLDRLLP